MLPTYKMCIYFLYCLDIDIPIQKTAYYSMTTRYMETKSLKTDCLEQTDLEQKQRLLAQTAGYFI